MQGALRSVLLRGPGRADPVEYYCAVTSPYSDNVMRLRGAAVLFWLLPKEDGKRDLRAAPLKILLRGGVFCPRCGWLTKLLRRVCVTYLGGVTCGLEAMESGFKVGSLSPSSVYFPSPLFNKYFLPPLSMSNPVPRKEYGREKMIYKFYYTIRPPEGGRGNTQCSLSLPLPLYLYLSLYLSLSLSLCDFL